ncbi:MAG: hypothetical protein M1823_000726 [Watsoniomyces obsoletus]|nr:MAG: hypothetical protein M1823_000726 [Watsoniomyces obsoletus]
MRCSRVPFDLHGLYAIFIAWLCGSSLVHAYQIRYVPAVDAEGKRIWLEDARKPALFTRDFGDCMGNSAVNVTRFDAAYYKDNMTVSFHLRGTSNIRNESIMMYIGVFAYGESRFELTFNPCASNIASLCPIKAKTPIEANGIIPVAPADVASIPPIALNIPDFEGQAIIRLFANSTQTQVGCYSAVVTNGATFSHPSVVGSILGLFVFVALVASVATAIYGEHIPTIRSHYAHSVSMFVVFAVLHHIYFTGTLSLHWPSVLISFWNNYAWAGGMIYTERMQRSINNFLRANQGNSSQVGAAGVPTWDDPKLFFSQDTIYQGVPPTPGNPPTINLGNPGAPAERLMVRSLDTWHSKRAEVSGSGGMAGTGDDGFVWYGKPVRPGMPLPGNHYGFAGTLALQNVAASNAFLTGLLWFLILMTSVVGAIGLLKLALEMFSKIGWIKPDRLAFFRNHWKRITGLMVLRMLFIGFFTIVLLAIIQLAYRGPAGVVAIAAIIFSLVLVGVSVMAGYACYIRLRGGRYEVKPARLYLRKRTVWRVIPWTKFTTESKSEAPAANWFSLPWRTITYQNPNPDRVSAHADENYLVRFGWLTARYRRTRWWFFGVWIVYEFIRACFYGGAIRTPTVQVFGLLFVEIVALIVIIRMRPFEATRLNALMIYLLGFSKVATLALSSAFNTRFNTARILTTVIGVVIIVIQGVLTIALMVAIVVGAISSYLSVTRNRETTKPKSWAPLREKYFAHLEKAGHDLPPPPPVVKQKGPEKPEPPSFNVASVRRFPKIEDEDPEFLAEIHDPSRSRLSIVPRPTSSIAQVSRQASVGDISIASPHPATVPYGARVHRASWSTRDLESLRAAGSSTNRLSSTILQGGGSSTHGSEVALAGTGTAGSNMGVATTVSSPTGMSTPLPVPEGEDEVVEREMSRA